MNRQKPASVIILNKNRSYLYVLSIILLLTTQIVFSETTISLQNQRNEVVKQYIRLLGKGDFKTISNLFTDKGMVVSSSGLSDNPIHFYKTLFSQTLSSPNSNLINLFEGFQNQDMMTAYFDFSWTNREGKPMAAKFLDLFVFEKETRKINALFIFSNSFQVDIMKNKSTFFKQVD